MGDDGLGALPAMQHVADISRRAAESRTWDNQSISVDDIDYLLGLIDVLLYPEQHHWSVSREYLRMSAVLVGYYGAQHKGEGRGDEH